MPAYLDHNATTPLSPAARTAMAAAMDVFGNPSSVHGFGREARRIVEAARLSLADRAGIAPQDIVFTSGATEANSTVLLGARAVGWPVFVSSIEHLSVLDAAPDAPRIAASPDGRIAADAVAAVLPEAGPFLVSVMAANNETGVIQPIAAIADAVHARGGFLHVDAVQALGKTDLQAAIAGADYATITAHKAGGPKGCGALFKVSADAPEIAPLLRGGGQEKRRRAGTENVVGLAGFGAVLDMLDLRLDEMARLTALRDRLEAAALDATPAAIIFGSDAPRLANTTAIGLDGLSAETAVIQFDLGGVAVGSGSACSSGKVAISHVLQAMDAGEALSRSAIRVSLGPETTADEVDRFITLWRTEVARRVPTSDQYAA